MFKLFNKQPKVSHGYDLLMREGMWDYIRRAKGWKNNQEAANALGYTRQYISMVASRATPATADFVVSLAVTLGSDQAHWYAPFEIVKKQAPIDPDHPRYNQAKHDGILPYQQYSVSGNLRKKDRPVEFRER